MSESDEILFQVWGARGSLFAGGADRIAFGGDTTCFGLSAGGGLTIVDAGSGLRAMGEAMAGPPPPVEIDLLLTHLHFDHICGLPFFEPVFSEATVLRVWSAAFERDEDFRAALERAMSPPVFPRFRDWDRVRLCTARAGMPVPLAMGGTATPFALNHPDGAQGWRIDRAGRAIAIAADHEAGDADIDAGIAKAARGVDLLVWDAMYTDEEVAARRGWGHSSWRQGLAVAGAAGAGHLLMTHHDPGRTDAALARMEREARAVHPELTFARAGWRRAI